MITHTRYVVIFFSILFVLFSCSNPVEEDGLPDMEIEQVQWLYENIAPSFWTSEWTDPLPTAFFSVGFYMTGEKFSESDIVASVIRTDDVYWSNSTDVAFEGDQYIDGVNRAYSSSLSSSRSVVPSGRILLEVYFRSGDRQDYLFWLPSPGSTSTSATKIYTEDFLDLKDESYSPMVKRATVTGSQLTDDTLTVDFRIDDPLVYSGYLWAYETLADETNYIGGYFLFRDFDTGEISSHLNNGALFATNGDTNTLVLTEDDFSFVSEKGFSDIHQVLIVLTDGLQHSGSSEITYDCRSISARTTLLD